MCPHGGREVDIAGDGFFATFSERSFAKSCAVTAAAKSAPPATGSLPPSASPTRGSSVPSPFAIACSHWASTSGRPAYRRGGAGREAGRNGGDRRRARAWRGTAGRSARHADVARTGRRVKSGETGSSAVRSGFTRAVLSVPPRGTSSAPVGAGLSGAALQATTKKAMARRPNVDGSDTLASGLVQAQAFQPQIGLRARVDGDRGAAVFTDAEGVCPLAMEP